MNALEICPRCGTRNAEGRYACQQCSASLFRPAPRPIPPPPPPAPPVAAPDPLLDWKPARPRPTPPADPSSSPQPVGSPRSGRSILARKRDLLRKAPPPDPPQPDRQPDLPRTAPPRDSAARVRHPGGVEITPPLDPPNPVRPPDGAGTVPAPDAAQPAVVPVGPASTPEPEAEAAAAEAGSGVEADEIECPRCSLKMQVGMATVDTGGASAVSGAGIYFHLGGRNRLPMMRFAETRRAALCAGCGGLWIDPVE